MSSAMRTVAAGALALVLVGACGGDDDEGASTPQDAVEATDGGEADDDATENDSADDGSDAAQPPGSGGGTLDLGGEAISLTGSRCYLEEQDAAAGGGKILFVVQGTGTDAAGDEVLIDVSRYDDESQFAGDAIDITVGDPMSGEAAGYSTIAPTGTVTLDGSTASADAVTLVDDADGSEVAVSFEISC
ncbi:MAG: hypothetical protein M5U14_15990 [Acidimicrobiia bacterium]|nr:hypothetical protein [Acidimicrobiia bacterium]